MAEPFGISVLRPASGGSVREQKAIHQGHVPGKMEKVFNLGRAEGDLTHSNIDTVYPGLFVTSKTARAVGVLD